MNRIRGAALAALLSSIPCGAQSPAELLQKGIYLQETEGNQDGAIQIYRQITASAGQSPAAVQAQYRIALAMLQKGDLNAASVEFSTLAARYPQGKALVARFASSRGIVVADAQPPFPETKNIHNGRYHDELTGLEFAVPASWTVRYDGASSDGGNMVGLAAPGSGVDYGIWMKPNEWSAAEISNRLRHAVEEKAKANSFHPGFTFRPESIQPRTAGGQQALSAVADYVENGRKMVNYYVWVYTPKTHSVFLAREVAAEDLPTIQANLDSLVATAQVP
ncbi:MAG: hypothetical protein ABUS49_06565 [Acidobacteriota bacterium]